jgi:ABC-type lipoprotein release transport system permease subunit
MITIMLGIFGGLFLVGFMRGMTEQRTDTALKTEVSHIQIHRPEYMIDQDFKNYIQDTRVVEDFLAKNNRVQGYSLRIVTNTLAKTTEAGTGVTVIGIDPETEKKVTDVYTKIIEGAYFEGVKRNPIVIGKKLAEKLDVNKGNKIILELQDTSGMYTPMRFKVAGIFKTNNALFDEGTVFIRNQDIRTVVGLDIGSHHEIAIFLKDKELIESMDQELENHFKNLTVETWKEGNLMLGYMSDLMDQYTVFIMLFILAALFFGIVNTMLMAILERRKELGMLMAIGMNKMRIFIMIMLETILLSLSGAVLGIVVGLLSIDYLGREGLDLSLWGEGFEAIGYDPVIYFSIDTQSVAVVIMMVVLTAVLAAVYPSYRALRLRPVEALKIEN